MIVSNQADDPVPVADSGERMLWNGQTFGACDPCTAGGTDDLSIDMPQGKALVVDFLHVQAQSGTRGVLGGRPLTRVDVFVVRPGIGDSYHFGLDFNPDTKFGWVDTATQILVREGETLSCFVPGWGLHFEDVVLSDFVVRCSFVGHFIDDPGA